MNKKTDYQEIIKCIRAFNKARNWEQYHQPKDLAISLSLEVAELLENFQWINSEEAIKKHMLEIEEKVADVFIYLLQFVDALDLDLFKITMEKIEKNAQKYPIKE